MAGDGWERPSYDLFPDGLYAKDQNHGFLVFVLLYVVLRAGHENFGFSVGFSSIYSNLCSFKYF